MPAILGIDAAWGPKAPSGVALLAGSARAGRRGGWRVVALAPSVEGFLALARGQPVNWRQGRCSGGPPEAAHLIAAARALCGEPIACVGMDMPLARSRVSGRRPCDNAIARRFVGVHSPLPGRPGAHGRAWQAGFARQGFALATAEGPAPARALLEVYPHAAAMALLGLARRYPYKVSRSAQYWPDLSRPERARRLLENWRRLRAALARELGPIPLPLPRVPPARLAALKRHEDALDALLCAWVAALYLEGRAEPFGDADSAIWAPRTAPR